MQKALENLSKNQLIALLEKQEKEAVKAQLNLPTGMSLLEIGD